MIRDRRAMPRYACPFTYLSLDTENGGILVNLSDGGLAFQAISPVQVGQKIQLRMELPGSKVPITSEGQVAWTDESGEIAGARLLNFSPEGRTLLRNWLASEKVNQASSQKSAALPKTAKADSEPKAVPADSENAAVQDEVPIEAGKADEVGELRSAFQFKTIETETRTWVSAARTQLGKLSKREKITAVAGGVSLVFLILLAGLYSYGRHSAFQVAQQRIEASLGQFKKNALEDGTVPAWVRRALSNNDSSAEQTKLSPPADNKKVAGASTRSKDKTEKTTLTRAPATPALEQVLVPSAPPLAMWRFRIQGNRQTLIVRANPTRPIPFQWATPDTSLRLLRTADSSGTLSSELSGRAPEIYQTPAYPPVALQSEIDGSVVVLANIDKDGAVSGLNLLSGNSVLAAAVMDAVRHWRYKPYVENGKPVAGDIRIKVTFNILPH